MPALHKHTNASKCNMFLGLLFCHASSGVKNVTIQMPVAQFNRTGQLMRTTSVITVLSAASPGVPWVVVRVYENLSEGATIPEIAQENRYIIRMTVTYYYYGGREEVQETFQYVNIVRTRECSRLTTSGYS